MILGFRFYTNKNIVIIFYPPKSDTQNNVSVKYQKYQYQWVHIKGNGAFEIIMLEVIGSLLLMWYNSILLLKREKSN